MHHLQQETLPLPTAPSSSPSFSFFFLTKIKRWVCDHKSLNKKNSIEKQRDKNNTPTHTYTWCLRRRTSRGGGLSLAGQQDKWCAWTIFRQWNPGSNVFVLTTLLCSISDKLPDCPKHGTCLTLKALAILPPTSRHLLAAISFSLSISISLCVRLSLSLSLSLSISLALLFCEW
jgi:hypothetical protein